MKSSFFEFPSDHVVLLDHGHLRIYRAVLPNGRTELQLTSALSLDYPPPQSVMHSGVGDGVVRNHGRNGTDSMASIHERNGHDTNESGREQSTPVDAPSTRQQRLIREVVSQINEFFMLHSKVTWSFSASPDLKEVVIEALDPNVRRRLQLTLTKNLVGQTDAAVIHEFCHE